MKEGIYNNNVLLDEKLKCYIMKEFNRETVYQREHNVGVHMPEDSKEENKYRQK